MRVPLNPQHTRQTDIPHESIRLPMPPIVDYTDDPEEDITPKNKTGGAKKDSGAARKASGDSTKSAPGGEKKASEKKKPSEPKPSDKKPSDKASDAKKSDAKKPDSKKSGSGSEGAKAAELKKAEEAKVAEKKAAEKKAAEKKAAAEKAEAEKRAAEKKAADKKAAEKKAADQKAAEEARRKASEAKEEEKRKAKERKAAEKERAREEKRRADEKRAAEKEAARAAARLAAEEDAHEHAADAHEPETEPEPETDLVDISIVIPVYNEIKRLPPTLEKVQEFLNANFSSWEIIVSDDGSRDGTVRDLEPKFPKVRFLRAYHNRGKGAAVRRGMLAAKGRRVLFSDADLSTPIHELLPMLERMDSENCDGVIASRGLPESVLELRQPWWREMAGKVFNQIIRPISGLPYSDTQCGFKLFSRPAARRIFSIARSEGWAFDVEVLVIGRVLGYSVLEQPVHWINAEGSKIRLSIDAPKMALDALRFRWWHFDGRYQPLTEREIRKLEY